MQSSILNFRTFTKVLSLAFVSLQVQYLVSAGAAYGQEEPQEGPVVDLQGVSHLQQVFQSDSGKVRLLVVLSPT